MADLENFNAAEVEPNQAFDLIPDGWLEAMITESEMKDTRDSQGRYLKLTFAILDERFKNRNLWDNLNLKNANPTTVQIARGQLSAICRAVGVLSPRDSSELHNLPLMIKVGHKLRNDTGEPQNVIKGFKAREGAPVLSQASATPSKVQQGQAAATGSSRAPWAKKAQ